MLNRWKRQQDRLIEEAQSSASASLALLRPTIRTGGSEIWASWNARRKSDAIDRIPASQLKPGMAPPSSSCQLARQPWFPG